MSRIPSTMKFKVGDKVIFTLEGLTKFFKTPDPLRVKGKVWDSYAAQLNTLLKTGTIGRVVHAPDSKNMSVDFGGDLFQILSYMVDHV